MTTLKKLLHLFALAGTATLFGEVNKVATVAPDVYFHEGDIKGHGHCNNGWIIFEDYVLVVDANFPSGAEEILPKIKAITDKPIRFAFDTHHHGDHAYGNHFWIKQGAVPVAHTGVQEEMRKYEPKRWEDSAKSRKDMAGLNLKPPTVLFPHEMFFDDGTHRVELHHFGVAHTHGDGFAWLPKEGILFTGDACVNGPYNYVGDGNITDWIKTLENAKKLHPKVVCPGHGPMSDGSLLEDQQQFFITLRTEAKKLLKRKKDAPTDKIIESIRDNMKKNDRIVRYVGDSLPAQLEKACIEMGGKPFLSKSAHLQEEEKHQHQHGHDEKHSG